MIFWQFLSEICIMPLGVSTQVFLRIKACEDLWLNISSLTSDLESDVMHISVFCFRQRGKRTTNITFIDVLPWTPFTAITKYPCKSSYLFPFHFVWNILRYLGRGAFSNGCVKRLLHTFVRMQLRIFHQTSTRASMRTWIHT